MSISKSRISSPLEAGTSILDVDHLPEHLNEALEYASKRLARRSMHISLVVVRRDYQLPRTFPSPTMPSTPCSPAFQKSPLSPRLAFASSPITTFRKLVRTGSAKASPLPSPSPSLSAFSDGDTRFRPLASHPTWPTSPRTPLSPPPMTPLLTSSSTTSTEAHEACTPHPFGIRLIYADLLTDRQKTLLRQVMERTEKKFRIGSGWLPQPLDPAACGLSSAITNRSLLQNDPLFASDGLTLVPLDRLYTFKAALASYSRTASPLRLEDAVDELRRLVLSRKGERITRAELARWYDWLGFSDASLRAVDRMYRRAYGGRAGVGGIEGVDGAPPPPPKSSSSSSSRRKADGGESEVETDFETDSVVGGDDDAPPVPSLEDRDMTPVARTAVVAVVAKAPSPKGPALKLQTQFSKPAPTGQQGMSMVGFTPIVGPRRDGADEEEPATARPGRESRQLWSPATIAEVLHDEAGGGSAALGRSGPMTPNGYDDISPITRGEWGFLMGDGGVKQGMKTAAVETF